MQPTNGSQGIEPHKSSFHCCTRRHTAVVGLSARLALLPTRVAQGNARPKHRQGTSSRWLPGTRTLTTPTWSQHAVAPLLPHIYFSSIFLRRSLLLCTPRCHVERSLLQVNSRHDARHTDLRGAFGVSLVYGGSMDARQTYADSC